MLPVALSESDCVCVCVCVCMCAGAGGWCPCNWRGQFLRTRGQNLRTDSRTVRIPVWFHDSELGGRTQRHEDFRTWDRAALISGASLGPQGGRE